MREFFKPWRRKVGVVTLGLACGFMGLWLRSLTSPDCCSCPVVYLLSINGGLLGEWTPENSADHWWNAFHYSSDLEYIDPYVDSDNLLSWRWRVAGFGVAGYDQNRFSAKVPPPAQEALLQRIVIRIPYWSLVLPLTLLSAWLLRSKTRATALQSRSLPLEPDNA